MSFCGKSQNNSGNDRRGPSYLPIRASPCVSSPTIVRLFMCEELQVSTIDVIKGYHSYIMRVLILLAALISSQCTEACLTTQYNQSRSM